MTVCKNCDRSGKYNVILPVGFFFFFHYVKLLCLALLNPRGWISEAETKQAIQGDDDLEASTLSK